MGIIHNARNSSGERLPLLAIKLRLKVDGLNRTDRAVAIVPSALNSDINLALDLLRGGMEPLMPDLTLMDNHTGKNPPASRTRCAVLNRKSLSCIHRIP